ncbi:MAG TPA: ABC transporter permease [Gemmatimonadaceae bacterium]|nr:ABC transporter permease [Gemmatimonadaceae bacterium]
MATWGRELRARLWRPGVREEVEHELAFHLEMRTRQFLDQGMTPAAARDEALRRMGDVERVAGVCRSLADAREQTIRRAGILDEMRQDLRAALRQFTRDRAVALVAVLTLALGVGANATMFSIVDRFLLHPLAHVRDADRVVELADAWRVQGNDVVQRSFPYAAFRAFQERLSAAKSVAMMTNPIDVPLGRGADAQDVHGSLVSASFFPLLGVHPALGRFFAPDEDRLPEGTPVVVVSYGLWRPILGGGPSALGARLELGSRTYTVIGVTPKGFTGPTLGAVDVWIPVTAAGDLRFVNGPDWATSRTSTWLRVFARLEPGVSRERLAAEATAINLESGEPRMATMHTTIDALPLIASLRDMRGTSARVAVLLGALSVLVVLIACANLANLLIARALRRRREIAVRVALGISRGRLVRQLLVEAGVLALLGGCAALLVAWWGSSAARTLLFGDVQWTRGLVDWHVLLYTLGIALASGVLAGLAPALQFSRPHIADALKAGAREGGQYRSAIRTVLLVAQAALSVILLVGAGLFVLSLHAVSTLPIGMQPDRVLLATMDLLKTGWSAADADALFTRMAERVRALPGIQSAAVAVTVPGVATWGVDLTVPGRDSLPQPEGGGPFINAVQPGYFATMGTRILRGRDFTDADGAAGAPVVIVNQTLAHAAWPGEDPIGKCVRLGDASTPCVTVVGVAENSRRQNWIEEPIFLLHVPLAQAPAYMQQRLLVVRPRGSHPELAIAAVRSAMQTTAADLPFANVQPMMSLYDAELRPWRLGAAMLGAFGVLAGLLVAAGLYGVISFTTTQRTQEIGVRLALGARSSQVLELVMREGLALAAAGGIVGVIVALAGARFIEPLLFHVSPREVAVYGAALGVLGVVATIATLAPAWRAAHVDPATALRSE